MQRNNILLLSLRGNIIGDSIREIALAKKIQKENNNSLIYYPCGKIIFDLLKENKYLKPIYIKEFDNFNNTNASKFNKIFSLTKVVIKIINLKYSFYKIIYSGSNVKIRLLSAKLISTILKSKFEKLSFQKGKGNSCELYFSKNEEENIKKYLIKNNKSNISICIESTDVNRMWGKENFIKLIENLEKKYNIFLLGVDEKYNKDMIVFFGNKIINLVGKLSIRETSLIIKNSSLFVGNDSGLAHIASAVNTNIIVLTLENTINEEYIFNDKNKTAVKVLQKPTINNILKKINEK